MKKPLIHLFLLTALIWQAAGQKKKVIIDPIPSPTPAASRLEGYLLREKLIENSWVKSIPFRNVGPTIMSGRVVDIEVDPTDATHFYVAYASGGLWETTNEGASFTPLFDHEIVMTIGDIAVDWSTETIYIGTGENNSSRSSYAGYGLYKSDDHGATWKHLGLEETHHIGRVLLHPTDPNIIWVAALGPLYSKSEHRGLYKTTDGGETWEKTLYINDETGIVELVINPQNPNELIAGAWQKNRKAWNFEESGASSALFKTSDGGVTWTNISSGDNGFPDTAGMGRVGIAYAPSNPEIIYVVLDNQDRRATDTKEEYTVTKETLRNMNAAEFASLSNNDLNDFLDRNNFPEQYNAPNLKESVLAGKIAPKDLVTYLEDANSQLFDTPVKGAEVYKSENSGETWTKTHEGYIEALVFSYGYYFGQIRVDAQNPDILYTMGVPLIKSSDGGKTWETTNAENVHSDHHALWLNPKRTGHLINGNDGGINISYDAGKTWIKCNSPAVGQFYTVTADLSEPYQIYGGLQDNGVWKGPSDYTYSRSWYEEGKYPYERLMGGDGMQVAVDTRTNDLVYTGYQFGNYFRINTTTSEQKYITPHHQLGESPLRWNWQSPIMLSPHNQDIVYFGSNKFHRSMNRGDDFQTMSGDLTKGGKKGDVTYGTLTTISESPKRFGLIYTGSDDGLIYVSKDAGQNWEKISDALPPNYWVSRVQASAHQEGRVYASLSGYRWDDFSALIYVSEDYGKTWLPIHQSLPKEPVNVIKEDPTNENILYVGTDHGVYVSLDRGKNFMAFQAGLPAVAVHDLYIHPREHDLIVGTHGRSIYIANVGTLQQLPQLSDSLKLFAPASFTFSENWGNKGSWHWDGYQTPEIDLEIFSRQSSKAQVTLKSENILIKTWEIELTAGINHLTYDLSLESRETLLIKSDSILEPKQNGKYYLPPGQYVLKITQGHLTTEAPLEIKTPRERAKRKGSE